MATFIVDARALENQNGIVKLELIYDGRSVEMTAERVGTLEELAELILAQSFPVAADPVFQHRLTIEAHQETGVDPETNEEYQFWVVDSVDAEQLRDEAARDGFSSLPGWSTWSADEASSWIDVNVTDLDSTKIALMAMARAICYLRDWRREA